MMKSSLRKDIRVSLRVVGTIAVLGIAPFAHADAPDLTNTRNLQEAVAGLQMLVSTASVIADNTPHQPGFYERDSSGRVIDPRTLAGTSSQNVTLGAPIANPIAAGTSVVTPPTVSQSLSKPVNRPVGGSATSTEASADIDAKTGAAVISEAPNPIKVVPVALPWVIEANSTVQDTLAAWSQKAGWGVPVWNATNPYRIVDGVTVHGSFIDALKSLAGAVPQIDIDASPTRKTITVSDAKIKQK